MAGFEAPFGRGSLWKQDLEHPPGNANDALIFAHPDAELDGVPVGGFHRASGGKRKNIVTSR